MQTQAVCSGKHWFVLWKPGCWGFTLFWQFGPILSCTARQSCYALPEAEIMSARSGPEYGKSKWICFYTSGLSQGDKITVEIVFEMHWLHIIPWAVAYTILLLLSYFGLIGLWWSYSFTFLHHLTSTYLLWSDTSNTSMTSEFGENEAEQTKLTQWMWLGFINKLKSTFVMIHVFGWCLWGWEQTCALQHWPHIWTGSRILSSLRQHPALKNEHSGLVWDSCLWTGQFMH